MIETSENPTDETKFQLKYNFPENESPFVCEMTKKGDDTYGLQEIIAINIRTSLPVLQKYFKHVFCIPIQIFYDEAVIGKSPFFAKKIHFLTFSS